MAGIGEAGTLRRFVLRARRVRAHSLVRDADALLAYARGEFQAQVDVSGRATVTRRLPEEEVFESLAARIRPLTVKSEPVHYDKVLDAIERTLAGAGVDEGQRARLQDLRRAWAATEIQGTQVQAYSMQSVRADGSEATSMVSDTQFAAAWLYADLVHADAQGPKQEALAFPLRERYAAAVRLFSHIAVLTVATLDLVESLREAGVLLVDESAWEDDVAVGVSELVEEVRVFIAPAGGPALDLRDSLDLGEEWRAFTVTELLRQNPANHVRAVLRDAAGEAIASYDAAVSRRKPDGDSAAWDVLVADSVVFRFSFGREGERLSGARLLGWDVLGSTNELKLASTQLMLQWHRAAVMALGAALLKGRLARSFSG